MYNYNEQQITVIMKMFALTRAEVIEKYCYLPGEKPKAMAKVKLFKLTNRIGVVRGSDSVDREDVTYDSNGLRSDDEYNSNNWQGHDD